MDCFNCMETTDVDNVRFDRHNTGEHRTAILTCSVCKKESTLQ